QREQSRDGHRGQQGEQAGGECGGPGEHGIGRPSGEPAVAADRQRRGEDGHQLAPENSARRLMTHRAMRFTPKVTANRMRPEAISASTPVLPASGRWLAMFAAIDWCWPGWSRKKLIAYPGESTISTAIVSPSARPRPSIAAEMMPERPNGRTAWRIISHRVAPRAREASSCSRGVCRNTSRMVAVMIGRIITA